MKQEGVNERQRRGGWGRVMLQQTKIKIYSISFVSESQAARGRRGSPRQRRSSAPATRKRQEREEQRD